MSITNQDFDMQIRLRAFEWLSEQTDVHDDILPRELLRQGFMFGEQRIPLVSPQGIFKPKLLDLPLTITSSPNSPYDDSLDQSGYLIYRYRGTNIDHQDNVGLREISKRGLPLIYLYGVIPGKYIPIWPVYIRDDDPSNLMFRVEIELPPNLQVTGDQVSEPIQEYRSRVMKTRLHQRSFRERVLYAYKTQCAVCRLKHKELLEASHIIPDSEPNSPLTVNNGLALCKLHHAAYDSLILGITSDFKLVIRGDILEEEDGPMLLYGLKYVHDSELILPSSLSDYPNKDFLDYRYQSFRSAI